MPRTAIPARRSTRRLERDTPALPASVSAPLERLAARLRASGLSTSTAKIYLGWTRRFLACVDEPAADPRSAVARFVAALDAQATSMTSRRQALAAIGYFLAEVRGLDPAPVLAPYRPRGGKSGRRPPTRTPATYLGGLDRVASLVRELVVATGRTPAEILAMRIGDLDLERGTISIRRPGRSRRRAIRMPFPAALRDPLVDQLGESWRLHQLDYLESLDRSGSTSLGPCALPTSTFRRHRLFPSPDAPARLHPRRGRAALSEDLVRAATESVPQGSAARRQRSLEDAVARPVQVVDSSA